MIKKIVLSLCVVLVLLVGAVGAYFYLLHPKSRAAPDVKAPSTPEAIARGRYLVHYVAGCVPCHTPIDETKPGDFVEEDKLLSGREFPVDPEMIPGRLVAPNITPDRETGIGAWTDGEVMRALREGLARDGRVLFPMMNYPQYRHFTDEDALAIIAYLRSVPPIKRKMPPTQIDFPVSMFVRTAPRPVEGPRPAWPTDPAERGKILLRVMSCTECHTPMKRGAPVEGMYLAGGNRFAGPFGVVYSSNITSHKAAGIGSHSDGDLLRVFREGKGKDGRSLWAMPWSVTRGTSEDDLRAVIAALRAVPPKPNLVPRPELKPE